MSACSSATAGSSGGTFESCRCERSCEKLERGLEPNRELAITFDDGYRDNYDNAMPVLEKLSLPATFFVVSQWIGTDVVPRWDERRGVRHPWMTWDQVRSLHRKGFEIGAHTQTPRRSRPGRRRRGARRDCRRASGARATARRTRGPVRLPVRRAEQHHQREQRAGQGRTVPLLLLELRRRQRPGHRSVRPAESSDLSVVRAHLTSLASTSPWGGASSPPAAASMPRHSMAGDLDRLPSSVSRVE